MFDFAIVVTYAVPALKYALKGLNPEDEIPYKPDYFDSRPVATEKVKHNARNYKSLLSRYIFLSTFSFFEAYFQDVLKEIVSFHEEKKLLSKVSIDHNNSIMNGDINKYKRKLQEYPTPKNRDRYLSYGKRLSETGYRFPSTLLSGFGLRHLIELTKGDNNIRAFDIPRLTEEILQLDLDQKKEVDIFHGFRNTRNKIAHGRASAASISLRKAIAANNNNR